jgi:hypothetical protein
MEITSENSAGVGERARWFLGLILIVLLVAGMRSQSQIHQSEQDNLYQIIEYVRSQESDSKVKQKLLTEMSTRDLPWG